MNFYKYILIIEKKNTQTSSSYVLLWFGFQIKASKVQMLDPKNDWISFNSNYKYLSL